MMRQQNQKIPQIGDIYLMNFGGKDNEQQGWRPGLVLQNNLGNLHSPNIIALPLTSSLKKQNQPTHILLSAEKTGLLRDSMVLCENPERMSKGRLGGFITSLSNDDMSKIATAYLLATSVISFINPDDLANIWSQASSLNMATA